MNTYSLDTDIVSKLLKKHPGNRQIADRLRQEIGKNSLLLICPVVLFEIRRELIFKGAAAQLAALEELAQSLTWKEFNASIWERACKLWSDLRTRGRAHNDADVLIAAHALHYGAVIVTGNVDHFRETGLRVENWGGPANV